MRRRSAASGRLPRWGVGKHAAMMRGSNICSLLQWGQVLVLAACAEGGGGSGRGERPPAVPERASRWADGKAEHGDVALVLPLNRALPLAACCCRVSSCWLLVYGYGPCPRQPGRRYPPGRSPPEPPLPAAAQSPSACPVQRAPIASVQSLCPHIPSVVESSALHPVRQSTTAGRAQSSARPDTGGVEAPSAGGERRRAPRGSCREQISAPKAESVGAGGGGGGSQSD